MAGHILRYFDCLDLIEDLSSSGIPCHLCLTWFRGNILFVGFEVAAKLSQQKKVDEGKLINQIGCTQSLKVRKGKFKMLEIYGCT